MQSGHTHTRARDATGAIDAHATEIGCCLDALKILDHLLDEAPRLGVIYPLVHRLIAEQLEGIQQAVSILTAGRASKAENGDVPID